MLGFLGLSALLVANVAGGAQVHTRTVAQPLVRPGQPLVTLLASHDVRQAPRQSAPSLEVVAARRPITGERTVLPVLGRATDGAGHAWLRVRLPGRPNSHTGWIERTATTTRVTGWHLVIELSRRRVVVYHWARVVRTFPAVVGSPSTPTPRGQFFIEESLSVPAGEAGAPFALALSARSDVYQEFDGGPGQIALHGIAHLGGVPGTAVSHGCVRLETAAITWLAFRVGPGVPVTIV